MFEQITRLIRLENLAGETDREVNALIGETTIIEGIYGSLFIDAQTKNPPLIQGKGDVFFLSGNNVLIRTRRLA